MSSHIYYKNTELARKYGVSNPTIAEWISSSILGKNSLDVEKVNNKYKILISPKNETELEWLSQKSRKFVPKSHSQKTIPDKSFYNFFNPEEILEIINDLKFKKQIKHKYVYKDPTHWDKFYNQGRPESTVSELELMEMTAEDLKYYLQEGNSLNLVELGQGNGLPSINIIKALGNVEKYIGIDLSKKMNDLAEQNIALALPKLKTSFEVKDIEFSGFSDILYQAKDTDRSSNLIITLGSTLSNIDDRVNVYKNIRRCMDENDLFVIDFSIYSPQATSSLSYIKDKDGILRDGWHLKLLGVDIDNCEIEISFNKEGGYKDKSYIMDKNYEITFDLYNKTKTLKLHKGDKISTWRHYLQTINNLNNDLEKAGFEILVTKKDKNRKYGLAICRVA